MSCQASHLEVHLHFTLLCTLAAPDNSPALVAAQVYTLDPLNGTESLLSPAEAARVLGGEVSLWGEEIDSSDVMQRAFTRAAAFAERMWSERARASSVIEAAPRLARFTCRLKARGVHEGCIEQIDRLFREALYGDKALDDEGRCRVDDLELLPEVQAEVAGLWDQIDTDNLNDLSDFSGYRQEFLQLFGFEVDGVDYDADVDPAVTIAQLVS